MGLWHNHYHNHWWRYHGHRGYWGFKKWGKKYPFYYTPTLTSTATNTSSKFVEEEREVQESVSSTTEIYERDVTYVRSRNVEFDTTSVKPFTFFTPFFSSVQIYDHVVPKLLEVRVTNGSFQPGETIESSDTFVGGKFIARLCTANHKEGPYLDPIKTYTLNPYSKQTIQEEYSESSTILNIDTKSLELPSETEFYGSVKVGMTLNGKSSGASAIVTAIRLVSDINGRLIGSFFIPDPNTSGNPKFNNGTNTFSLLDVNDLSLSDQARSIAEAEYYTLGTENVTENIVTTTRDIKVTPAHTQTTTTVTNVTTISPYYNGFYRSNSVSSILFDMNLILDDLIEAERQEVRAFGISPSADGTVISKFDITKFRYPVWTNRTMPSGWGSIKYYSSESKINQSLETEYTEQFEALNRALPVSAKANTRGSTTIDVRLSSDSLTIDSVGESRLAELSSIKSKINQTIATISRNQRNITFFNQ